MNEWLFGYVHREWYIQEYQQQRNHVAISKYEKPSRTTE
jgi:hypothetical protein